ETQLLFGPALPGLGIAANARSGETIEGDIIGGMHGDELALQVGGKLGDFQAVTRGDALQVVAVGFAFGGALQVKQAGVPGGDLHAAVSESRGPSGDGIELVEWRDVRGELREEECRTFYSVHACQSLLAGELGPETCPERHDRKEWFYHNPRLLGERM